MVYSNIQPRDIASWVCPVIVANNSNPISLITPSLRIESLYSRQIFPWTFYVEYHSTETHLLTCVSDSDLGTNIELKRMTFFRYTMAGKMEVPPQLRQYILHTCSFTLTTMIRVLWQTITETECLFWFWFLYPSNRGFTCIHFQCWLYVLITPSLIWGKPVVLFLFRVVWKNQSLMKTFNPTFVSKHKRASITTQ